LAIAGNPIEDLSEMNGLDDKLPIEQPIPYLVVRNGQEIEVAGPYTFPPMVNFLVPRGAAYDAGLQVGDVITNIDGKDVIAFNELKQAVESSDGAELALTIWRDGDLIEKSLTPQRLDEPQEDGGFKTFWRIGVALDFMFEPQREFVGFGNAATYGVNKVSTIVTDTLSGLYHVATGSISTCYLTGPVGIAETSGAMASQGLDSFIFFIAFLSTAIGLMNLLPIPVLDGGHLVFHVYEAVVGRPPNDKFFRVLMSIGLVFILGFMIFAFTNDIACTV
jgi:regulator of sigma E protease